MALLEALLPKTLDLVVECLDQAVQGCLLRLAGTIEAGGSALCRQEILLPVCSVEGSTERDPSSGESQAKTTPRRCRRGLSSCRLIKQPTGPLLNPWQIPADDLGFGHLGK